MCGARRCRRTVPRPSSSLSMLLFPASMLSAMGGRRTEQSLAHRPARGGSQHRKCAPCHECEDDFTLFVPYQIALTPHRCPALARPSSRHAAAPHHRGATARDRGSSGRASTGDTRRLPDVMPTPLVPGPTCCACRLLALPALRLCSHVDSVLFGCDGLCARAQRLDEHVRCGDGRGYVGGDRVGRPPHRARHPHPSEDPSVPRRFA